MLILVVALMIIVISIYIAFLTLFSYKDNTNGQHITIMSERFIAIPFLLFSIVLLSMSLRRLKSSKARASESGMLRPSLLMTLIILNTLILLNDIIGALGLDERISKNLEWIYCNSTVILLFLI